MKDYKQKPYKDNLLTSAFTGSKKTLEKLEKVYGLIKPLVIESLKEFRPKTRLGRPGNDPEVLFKILFIQKMQGQSDRDVLDSVIDRISYRRFVGITSEEDIPDRAALIRFRKRYFKSTTPKKLFNKLFGKLREKGVIVKAGSMLDSQIIESPGKRSRKKDRRDKYAKSTKKHKKSYFGYKFHANVDRDTKLLKKICVTAANTHDFKMIDKLISKRTTREVIADKGYASRVQESIYKDMNIKNSVMRKSYRGHKLTKFDEERNKRISKIRARVEHIFGRIVNEFKYVKTRYFKKYMNEMDMFFIGLLYNAKEIVRMDYLS